MALLSPGVESKETSLTSTTSSGATGRGGLVGQFQWGPAYRITQVSNETTLQNLFGEPDDRTAASYFTSSNFLNYGNDLRVVRVVDEELAKNASTIGGILPLHVTNPGTSYVTTRVIKKNPMADAANWTISQSNPQQLTIQTAAVTGSYVYARRGNNVIMDNSVSPSRPAIGYIVATDGDGPIQGVYYPRAALEATRAAHGDTDYTQYTYVLGGGLGFQGVINKTVEQDGGVYYPHEDLAQDAFADTDAAAISALCKKNNMPTIASLYPGDYGSKIKVSIATFEDLEALGSETLIEKFPGGGWANVNFKQQVDGKPQEPGQVAVMVHLGSTLVETHVVSINQDDKDIYGGSMYMDSYFANGNSNYIYMAAAGFVYRSGEYSLGGGVDVSSSANEFTAGWDLFADPDIIYVNLLMNGGSVDLGTVDSSTVSLYLMQLADNRKDTLALIDPPLSLIVNKTSTTAVSDLGDWRRGKDLAGAEVTENINFQTSYGLISGNAKYQYDKYNDKNRWVGLSGDIAGLCVNTDNVANPWESPAGFNRGQIRNVKRLAIETTQSQRDTMYELQINPIVSFSGRGTILYGDKTSTGDSTPFNRVNVRRLFNMVKKAVGDAAQYKLFELNDAFTRASWKSETDSYVGNIKSLGGVIDFVSICDETNNTAQVIDTNQFVGTLYIKPPRSINFITLNFVAVGSGVNIDELV